MSAEPHLQSVRGTQWVGGKDDFPTPPSPSVPGITDNPGGSQPPTSGSSSNRAPGKVRPEQSVPTDRMRFDKQLITLQSYAQLSGRNKQPVTADYLGKALEMSTATAGLCGGFFKDSGWVERAGRAYVATDALLEYQRRINLDPEDADAVKYLADAARRSWYWEAVEPMLGVGVRQNMVLVTLSQAANAHDHKPQLLLLIDWMAWLGMVRKENDMVYPQAGTATTAPAWDEEVVRGEDTPTGTSAEQSVAMQPTVVASSSVTATPRMLIPTVAANPEHEPSGSNVLDVGALVSFNFSVRITAEDAAKLTPENIASLLEVVDKLRG